MNDILNNPSGSVSCLRVVFSLLYFFKILYPGNHQGVCKFGPTVGAPHLDRMFNVSDVAKFI